MASFLVTVFIVKLFLVGTPSAIVYKLAYQLSLICCALVKVCVHLDCPVIVDVVNYNVEAEPLSVIIPPVVALGDKRLILGRFFSAFFSVASSVRDLFFHLTRPSRCSRPLMDVPIEGSSSLCSSTLRAHYWRTLSRSESSFDGWPKVLITFA
jgi:hypothetical protein